MEIKIDTPVESSQTSTVNIAEIPKYRFVGYEELTFKKVIELEEQVKIINEKLDKLLGER